MEVVIVAAARTPIGAFGGSLRDLPAAQLGAVAVRAALARAAMEPDDVGALAFAGGVPADPQDLALARAVAARSRLPATVAALDLALLEAGGALAIALASILITIGEAEVVVAGAATSASRVPYWAADVRFGYHEDDASAIDPLAAALADPVRGQVPAALADAIATAAGISREAQDAFAARSHARAVARHEEGGFAAELAPLAGCLACDEQPRSDRTASALAALKLFHSPDGTVTVGNSAPLGDGAVALVLCASHRAPGSRRAQLLAWAHEAGEEPASVARTALARAGIGVEDLAAVEGR